MAALEKYINVDGSLEASKIEVFSINLCQEEEYLEERKVFQKVVMNQLQVYGINLMEVTSTNVALNKRKLDEKPLVIVYNSGKIQNELDENIEQFLEKAKEKQADIWPVAFSKEARKPVDNISKKQSYDIWEQLRCRGLDKIHISAIAKAFSRKIIARELPTLYNNRGEVFISHRRIDGEEIAALIYDKIKIQEEKLKIFRDVTKVNVGDEAQTEIDEVMKDSEIFIFIHTNKAAESDWILKELRFALLRNIPILWVQIDGADIKKLRIKPSDQPHLSYSSEDFEKEETLTEIVDEILQRAFELIMLNSNKIFDYLETIENLFKSKLQVWDRKKMIYSISMERKGYHYPQRNINQYIQIFGRTVTEKDVDYLREKFRVFNGDSIAILSNKIINISQQNNIVMDSIEDFYYHWENYINGGDKMKRNEKQEIVISGAFPDCDEIYKQSLTDALIKFAKVIVREGYILTFGAHPTFQELFFEVAKQVDPVQALNRLSMFISNWFLNNNSEQEEYYRQNCKLNVVDKMQDLEESLSLMRKKMIQRDEVKALVCLGGKIKTDKSQEGIREEIKLATEYGIPVFIVGSVGGCSAEVALEYKNNGWKELNEASKELNEAFLEEIDYFKLAQSMLKYIECNYK